MRNNGDKLHLVPPLTPLIVTIPIPPGTPFDPSNVQMVILKDVHDNTYISAPKIPVQALIMILTNIALGLLFRMFPKESPISKPFSIG